MSMQITRAGEYALRSLIYLASRDTDTRVMASQVASAESIPVNFVRKILESLAKTGLVHSYRGAAGGFTLGRPAAEITLRDVIEAVEGPIALNQCWIPAPCKDLPVCPMSQIWKEAQQAVESTLARHSLADVVRTRESHEHAGVS